jgi:hypothetical protein
VNSKFYGKLDLTSNATQPVQNFIPLPCNSGFKIKNVSFNNIDNIGSSILSTCNPLNY